MLKMLYFTEKEAQCYFISYLFRFVQKDPRSDKYFEAHNLRDLRENNYLTREAHQLPQRRTYSLDSNSEEYSYARNPSAALRKVSVLIYS